MSNQLLQNSGLGIVSEAKRVHELVDDKKYIWGGKTLNGFDCSGFVGYVLSNLFPEKRTHFQTSVQGFIDSNLFELLTLRCLATSSYFPQRAVL